MLAFAGLCLTNTLTFTGGLIGGGNTKQPMYIAFLTQIILLVGICEYLDRSGRLTPASIWMATSLGSTGSLAFPVRKRSSSLRATEP